LTRHGISLTEARGLTVAEAESYLDLLADMAAGKTGGTGETHVNQRLLRKRRSAERKRNKGGR